MARMLFTTQNIVADGGHAACLMFPLGLDIEARLALVRVLCHALGELLQAFYINTVEHIGHDRSFKTAVSADV